MVDSNKTVDFEMKSQDNNSFKYMGTEKPLKSQSYSFGVIGSDIILAKKWNFSNFLIEQEYIRYQKGI